MPDRDRSTSSPDDMANETGMVTPGATPPPPPSDLQSSPTVTFTDTTGQEFERNPVELKDVCRPKLFPSRCLDKDFLEDEGFYFQSIAEAQAPMNRAQWHAPGNDDTIPKTNKEAQIVVKKLFEAMKDTSIAKDTPGNAYRKRMTPGRSISYQDWAIEACAWDIVRVISIHTQGFKAPIYDRTIVDHIGQTQEWNFRERIDWICVVLKTSKSVAVTIMKNEKIWTIIGAPHKLYNSTLVNSVSNAHRGVWVKTGRKADVEHQARANNKRRKVNHVPNNQDADMGKATETATASSTPVLKQPKARKSKYDVTPLLAIPAKRNMYADTAPVHSSPVASNVMKAPSAIYEHPDAEMVALMFGPLPTRDTTQNTDAVVAEQDTDKYMEGEPIAKEETIMETTEDIAENATEAMAENVAKQDIAKDSVDMQKAPRGGYMDGMDRHPDTSCKGKTNTCESQGCDEATLEGAILLTSLHTAG